VIMLMNDEFTKSITYSTNSTQAVKTRFSTMEKNLGAFIV
jgi:hypothetical protein